MKKFTTKSIIARAAHAVPAGFAGNWYPKYVADINDICVFTDRGRGIVCPGEDEDVVIRVGVPYTSSSNGANEEKYVNYLLFADGTEYPQWRLADAPPLEEETGNPGTARAVPTHTG